MGSVVAALIAVGLSLISTRPSDFLTFCKFIYSYFYILMFRKFVKKRFDLYDMEALHDPIKVGFLPPQLEMELESPQPESHLLHAADEIFIYGVNSSSESLVVRIARTVNSEAEAWIFIRLKDGKTYKLHKTSGYQNSCSDIGREFTCGDLKMHYIIPMRRWRIFYNGLLGQVSEDDTTSDKLVYVKFAFIWAASSDLFDFTTDINGATLAFAIAKCKWKSCNFQINKLHKSLNSYAQAGAVHGTISVDGEFADRNIYLFGERIRFLGEAVLESGTQFTHILGQISRNGCVVHIVVATIPGVVNELKFGFLVLPSGVLTPFSDIDMHLRNDEDNSIVALLHTCGLEFKVKGRLIGNHSHLETHKEWDGLSSIDCLEIQMNELKGSGVLIKRDILKPPTRSICNIRFKEIPEAFPSAVSFSDELCEVSKITGGKGSSLGRLTQLSKEYQNFIVPKGIIVTTSAYDAFVNKDIRNKIRSLEDVLYGKTSGDVKESCQKVMDEVVRRKMPDAILHSVVECLQRTFGEQFHTKKFAVRSSATGEDTEQMSAAGQMETYLGITGFTDIILSLKKCWASQFSFIAVQYKRQNGQILNSPMAVVIQEMVSCDFAGVLFTCDPLTGNPSLMTITANYGLGESVVSGLEEPDTIELTRNDEDKLEIKNKIIGEKSHRVVLADRKGTNLVEVSENEKVSCCLSDSMSLRLGNIAIQIEKSYHSKRDIEWGFWNNDLYIFQSRPVTSGTEETDYEIDHETDEAMRIEKEYYTVCSVGEVVPGAMSPLGADLFFKYLCVGFQRRSVLVGFSKIRPRYYMKGIIQMYHHVMLLFLDLFEFMGDQRDTVENMLAGMLGRKLDDEEVFEIAAERILGLKKTWKIMMYCNFLKPAFSGESILLKAYKHYGNYHIPVEGMKTSKEVFEAMLYACDDLCEAFVANNVSAQCTSLWNMVVLNFISKARGGTNPDAYLDLAKLLESLSGVESAEVPAAMQSLAYHIGKEMNAEEFKKKDIEETLYWLQTSPTEAGIKFRNFLDRHGHRCVNELDIRSTPWGKDPKLLIKFLQNLVGSISKDTSVKKVADFDELLKDLGLQLKFPWRIILKYFILPRCRKAVGFREATKSFIVKLLDEWRKGNWYLAKLLVLEGRIPDEDLMFFMTLEDIQELIESRSPKIISKANHRRKRHPILDKYVFPAIMKGFPKPVNADDTPIDPTGDDFEMKGIPVSQGAAKGFVRVALNLEEASHLKEGEILLTHSTDIGWTPYFPLLSGVATELGSLISHGAVISREYGIPCIVALHGATRQFQTGDYVLLDGNRGILRKLPPP